MSQREPTNYILDLNFGTKNSKELGWHLRESSIKTGAGKIEHCQNKPEQP